MLHFDSQVIQQLKGRKVDSILIRWSGVIWVMTIRPFHIDGCRWIRRSVSVSVSTTAQRRNGNSSTRLHTRRESQTPSLLGQISRPATATPTCLDLDPTAKAKANASTSASANPIPGSIRTLTSTASLQEKASTHLLRLAKLDKEADHVEARAWVDGFTLDDIPKDAYEVSRSRSSGPGGQHVNKTESKITIRCDLTRAKGLWLPPFVFQPLTKVPHYIPSPPSIQISSQQSRKASQNLASTLASLHDIIARSARSVIVNPTSDEQKDKVRGYIKKENERRLEGKKRASAKRASRMDID
ncbi:hypothetical protein IAU59_006200 [Kwoniella sp. CBS 9459]